MSLRLPDRLNLDLELETTYCRQNRQIQLTTFRADLRCRRICPTYPKKCILSRIAYRGTGKQQASQPKSLGVRWRYAHL